ncbi:efflux transporter, outer membrane factor (OMF) lipoprotein, NodT family [Sphingomonas sp. OV641]|jgi:NodT family efflux transporter outer membrane factor (OMF) lipoprotein|uniref:TolC family protein n=2 Tax=Sphingomonas TaxID=13687 RepID=A0ABX2JJR4_9SPHN|nr:MULTISPECIES: TolC family protein [Sphingomonas]MBX8846738.1 TolC family protein [Sphingomonas melonis]MBX8855696.1 TolC family protein [Sphingomonas melonis]MBX8900711.1 TolC family protein [Sphingomonas melonis]MDG5973451.1 TolC family protein [Sphingomonas paucimobilis]NTS66652.1 TolC family protein [Sphingomonas hominis]
MIRRLAPAAALLASACMSVPKPPPTVAPDSATGAFASLPVASIAPVPDDWWRLYDDPVLDGLVRSALTANADLRVAYANLDGARAALRQARAARLPQTTIESALGVDNPAGQPSASGNVPTTDYDIAATASWDLDLFGRLRSAATAAGADTEAQAAVVDGLRVAVVADTVLAYVDLCGSTRAIATAREVAAAQDRSVALVREQLRAGEVSPLEVSQVATIAAATRAAIAPFEAQRANALYRLATLQGRPPAEARAYRFACTAAPRLRGAAPVGDGTALLLRRPDVREAERRLAAAAARIGVARADLYPRVNLGGAVGLLSGGISAAVTPLVSWAFPNQAPARARLEQARATERAALAGWDVAVLRSLREVETALAAYDAETRRNRDLATASREAQAYARRAAARVRLGDAPGLLQVDAQRAAASATLQQVQSDIAVSQNEVALFRALGGGWRVDAAAR